MFGSEEISKERKEGRNEVETLTNEGGKERKGGRKARKEGKERRGEERRGEERRGEERK